ncbi:MAG: hypothetical protein QXF25_02390 [Candidatus Pacearchaeota archaeon]
MLATRKFSNSDFSGVAEKSRENFQEGSQLRLSPMLKDSFKTIIKAKISKNKLDNRKLSIKIYKAVLN